MSNLKQKIHKLVVKYPMARENYNQLMNHYVAEYVPSWNGDFGQLPAPESITRTLRQIRIEYPQLLTRKGLYQGKPKVVKLRKQLTIADVFADVA